MLYEFGSNCQISVILGVVTRLTWPWEDFFWRVLRSWWKQGCSQESSSWCTEVKFLLWLAPSRSLLLVNIFQSVLVDFNFKETWSCHVSQKCWYSLGLSVTVLALRKFLDNENHFILYFGWINSLRAIVANLTLAGEKTWRKLNQLWVLLYMEATFCVWFLLIFVVAVDFSMGF